MGVLNKSELERRIKRGELILHPRLRKDGDLDIQPASYDLTAGKAVWKEEKVGSLGKTGSARIVEAGLNPAHAFINQPYVVLQPGQMVSVITHEEIKMPLDLCGTVYSKNGLALNGIFAFNAGHVDPGFEGPIVIRLINLRATPWTFTLGDRIFTIVFQTLDTTHGDKLEGRGTVSAEQTLLKVRHFTDVALSNALFDLYAQSIEDRLSQYRMETISILRDDLRKEFIREDKFGQALWRWMKKNVLAILGFIGLVLGIVKNWPTIQGFFK